MIVTRLKVHTEHAFTKSLIALHVKLHKCSLSTQLPRYVRLFGPILACYHNFRGRVFKSRCQRLPFTSSRCSQSRGGYKIATTMSAEKLSLYFTSLYLYIKGKVTCKGEGNFQGIFTAQICIALLKTSRHFERFERPGRKIYNWIALAIAPLDQQDPSYGTALSGTALLLPCCVYITWPFTLVAPRLVYQLFLTFFCCRNGSPESCW